MTNLNIPANKEISDFSYSHSYLHEKESSKLNSELHDKNFINYKNKRSSLSKIKSNPKNLGNVNSLCNKNKSHLIEINRIIDNPITKPIGNYSGHRKTNSMNLDMNPSNKIKIPEEEFYLTSSGNNAKTNLINKSRDISKNESLQKQVSKF